MDQVSTEFPDRTDDDNWVVYSVRSPDFLRLFEKHQQYAGRYATKLMFSQELLIKIDGINSAEPDLQTSTANASSVLPTLSTEPELAVAVKTTGEISRHDYDDKMDTFRFLAEDIPFPSLPVQTRTVSSCSSLARLFSVILKPSDLLFVIRNGSAPESSIFVDLSQRSSSMRVIFHVRLDPHVPFERRSRDYVKISRANKVLSDEVLHVEDSRLWRIIPMHSAFTRSERNGEVTDMELNDTARSSVDQHSTAVQTSTQENQSTGTLNGPTKKRKREWSKILQDDLDLGPCSSDNYPENVEEALKETQPIFRKKPFLTKHVALEIKIAPVTAPPVDSSDAEHCSQLTSSEEFFSAKTAVSSEGYDISNRGLTYQMNSQDDEEFSQRLL